MLAETRGVLVMVVVVAVDFLNRGVDCVRVASGCETPIVGHGEIVMGVEIVEVGKEIEKSKKKSSMIGTEVGIENVTSGLVVICTKTIGCEVSTFAFVACRTGIFEMVLDSESS